jgi:hypothetical protein
VTARRPRRRLRRTRPSVPPPATGAYLLALVLSPDRVRLSGCLVGPDEALPPLPGQLVATAAFAERPTTERVLEQLVRLVPPAVADLPPERTAALLGGRGWHLLAEGVAPIPRQPARWQPSRPILLAPGTYDTTARPVRAGEEVAALAPAEPGAEGRDPFGRTLPPPEADAPPLLPGSGVRQTGDRLFADRSGYLAVVRSRSTLLLEIADIPTVAAENLSAAPSVGGLVVRGALAKAHITRDGPLLVDGSVADARLASVGHDLVVHGNVVRSQLAVRPPPDQERLVETLRRAVRALELFVATLGEIVRHPSFAAADLRAEGPGRLVGILLRQPRQAELIHAARAFAELATAHPARPVAEHLVAALGLDGGAPRANPHRLELLLHELRALDRRLSASVRGLTLHAQACEMSELEATGTVHIHGSGVYRSAVVAGGSVLIPDGQCRASTLTARERVVVGELGSPSGSYTRVSAQELCARSVHPGVVVELKGMPRVVEVPLFDVRFTVRGGEIVEEPWNGGAPNG